MTDVRNVSIAFLAESIYQSGYSYRVTEPHGDEYKAEVTKIEDDINLFLARMRRAESGEEKKAIVEAVYGNPHIKRAARLANVKAAGEDQFLTGIKVDFDLRASILSWRQIQRYKFIDFTSSFSTMHSATKMDFARQCNQYVAPEVIASGKALEKAYKDAVESGDTALAKSIELRLLYNLPAGFELTAGMSTNYRALKNVYAQRRHHKLPDWQFICDWIERLPMAGLLITGRDYER